MTWPPSSTRMARAGCTDRSRPRLSIDMPLHLPPFQRQRARARNAKHLAIHPRQQAAQPALVRGAEHDDPCSLVGRKQPVIEIIAIESDERATELPRQAIVLDVTRAPEIVVLED